MQPIGDIFLRMLQMLVAPVVFFTIVDGITKMEDTKSLAAVGGRLVLYYALTSLLAVLVGAGLAMITQPGSGSNRASAYRSEGEQYRLYKDLGVTWNSGGSKVSLPDEYWWLRSPEVVNTRWYMIVAPDGAITYGHRPGTENAIILGFCV